MEYYYKGMNDGLHRAFLKTISKTILSAPSFKRAHGF